MALNIISGTAVIPISNSFGLRTPLSFAAWVKPVTTGGSRSVFGGTAGSSLEIQIQNSGTLSVVAVDTAVLINASTPISDGVWTHIGFSYDLVTARAFNNGVADGTNSTSVAITFASYRFGTKGGSPSEPYNGLTSDLAVWGCILSPPEWRALAQGTKRPNEIRPASLIGYWPFMDDIGGRNFKDVMKGYTASWTSGGSVAFSSDQPSRLKRSFPILGPVSNLPWAVTPSQVQVGQLVTSLNYSKPLHLTG